MGLVPVVDALSAFVDEVGDSGPVAVEGARSAWEVGGLPATGTRLVRAPVGVLEHRPEEMTVRVLAGTPVCHLQEVLARAGQRTALIERGGTVGGALAVGHDHIASSGRGMSRHSLLQARYVSAEGKLVKAGGPMIKNVSGYDLPRLIVGSLGTLGLIAEVILRTNPIPPSSGWFRSLDVNPFDVRRLVRRPSAVLWDGSQTWLQLEGHEIDVEAELRSVETIGGWEATEGPPSLPRHRWSIPPGQLRELDGVGTGAFVASVLTGTVFASQPPPTVEVAPALADLFKRIKAQFDPTGRMNPGRFPGGPQ